MDFHVDAGEVVALVGDNGAGKLTLVKTVSGVNLADSGEFRFLGEPAHIKSPQDATNLGIATVYQDLALADNLDVAGNLFLGHEEYNPGPLRWLWTIDDIKMEKESGELIRSLSARIPSVTTPVASLSGGQRQIVAIARALLGEPEARHARRAHGRPRRRPDAAGARPDPRAQAARAGGGGDQPQPRSTSSRSPTASWSSSSAATRATSSARRRPARRSSARSPAVSGSPGRRPRATPSRPRRRREHRRAGPPPPGRRRGARRPLDALHAARAGGGARLPPGHRRPDHHLDLLLRLRGELPHRRQPDQPDAPDRGARDHRHRRRDGAAARRDRPVGRHRQRPRPRR